MFERQVGGYDLRCDIVLREDGTYHIVICAMKSGSDDPEVRWEIPVHPPIRDRALAERHAKFVILGVHSIDGQSGPKYTVV
jgi:hypothetical protein